MATAALQALQALEMGKALKGYKALLSKHQERTSNDLWPAFLHTIGVSSKTADECIDRANKFEDLINA